MKNGSCSEYPQHSSSDSILTLETPDLEDIARAIWQRQHDSVRQQAIHRQIDWRDQSLPSRYWDEFLLDASAVLSLLRREHIKYQNKDNFVISKPKSC
jgi:hypothetical protein